MPAAEDAAQRRCRAGHAAQGAGKPARAADDGGGQIAAIAQQVFAGDEAAHAVTQDGEALAGKALEQHFMGGVHILHQVIPAVLAAKEAQLVLARILAMAQVAMPGHGVARRAQRARQPIIAGNVLSHAMHQLNHAAAGRIRLPQVQGERLARDRGEGDFLKRNHAKAPFRAKAVVI